MKNIIKKVKDTAGKIVNSDNFKVSKDLAEKALPYVVIGKLVGAKLMETFSGAEGIAEASMNTYLGQALGGPIAAFSSYLYDTKKLKSESDLDLLPTYLTSDREINSVKGGLF